VVVGQPGQRPAQLAALPGRQRRQQRLLRRFEPSLEALERSRSSACQLHDVAAPVLLVAHARA